MTATAQPSRPPPRPVAAQSEGGTSAMQMLSEQVVPAYMLDGGEVVILAIKPSPWMVPLISARALAFSAVMILLAETAAMATYQWYLYQVAVWLAAARLIWAVLQWVSRLYVLTNRRMMRFRGVFNVELFECPLVRIQNTTLTLSLWERLVRIGSIRFETAAEGGRASWRMIARPLEVHERIREAISRARSGGNGL